MGQLTRWERFRYGPWRRITRRADAFLFHAGIIVMTALPFVALLAMLIWIVKSLG